MKTRLVVLCMVLVPGSLLADDPGAAVNATAIVRGTVRTEGVPPPQHLEVFKHREVCGPSITDDSLVIGAEGALRYAVVRLEGVAGGREIERDSVHVLDNRECHFLPHVTAASIGQWLLLTNSDPILHNADAYHREEKRTLFNVALPPGKQVREPLARPGTIRVTCSVRHTWMQAYVVVAEHPYITVTDAEGEFEVRDVPAGRYTLRVWHERLGTLERPVLVEAGGASVEDFKYAL